MSVLHFHKDSSIFSFTDIQNHTSCKYFSWFFVLIQQQQGLFKVANRNILFAPNPTLCQTINNNDTLVAMYPFSNTNNNIISSECSKEKILHCSIQNDAIKPTLLTNKGTLPSFSKWEKLKRDLMTYSDLGARVLGAFRLFVAATNTFITVLDYKVNYPYPYNFGMFYQWKFRNFIFFKTHKKNVKENIIASEKNENSKVHLRAANRLFHVCEKQGGVYTKLGQYLSTLTHVLPYEYTSTLARLTDQAKALPWSEIEVVLQDDFKQQQQSNNEHCYNPNLKFSSIDAIPIAAASLAQVHRGIRKDTGEEVAIKLQFPHLRRQTAGDMKALRFLIRFIGWMFPEYQFSWLFPEFEQNITQELDFCQEAFNAERMAKLFRHRKDIYIPKIHWDLTTNRCLVMEFINGFKITDDKALKMSKISKETVARLVGETFGEMLYVHGLIHCDLHPGNLFVRRCPNIPQLVVLDHGMYRRLDPAVRLGYCRLSKFFMSGERAIGKQACKDLKIPLDVFDRLANHSFLSGRSEDKQKLLPSFIKKDKTSSLDGTVDCKPSHLMPSSVVTKQAATERLNLANLNTFIHSLPRDVLWIFRTASLVGSLHLQLEGNDKSLAYITQHTLQKGINLGLECSSKMIDDLEIKILDSWLLERCDTYYNCQSALNTSWEQKGGIGPLARAKLLDRIEFLQTMNRWPVSKEQNQIIEKTTTFPPPLNWYVFIKDHRRPWFMLPGAATLNLPLCSEIVSWQQKRYPLRRKCWNCMFSFWNFLSFQIDRILLSFKLWMISMIINRATTEKSRYDFGCKLYQSNLNILGY